MKINFLRSASWVAALTLLSRISGYFRELLLLQCIGVNAVSDTLSTLIKIPAFFRRIFAEGAMQVAFLPIFTDIKEKEGEDAAYKFAASLLGVLSVALTLVVIIAEWKWDLGAGFVFSGVGHQEQRMLFSALGKIIFPYLFFISIHSFFGSISSAYGRFGIFNFSHTVGNVFILLIIVIVLLQGCAKETCAYWVSWAILGSGVVQCALMIFGCWYQGIRPVLPVLGMNKYLKLFSKKFFSAVLSVSSVQLNTIIGAIFAAQLPTKGASYLNYADRFQQLPLSLVGISLTSVLLPLLAHQRAEGNHARAWRSEQNILRFSFMLSTCITLFFWMTAFSLVGCLLYPSLKSGVLAWRDAVEIAHTVMIFSLTFPAYIGIKILITRCFAYGYTRLPWLSGLLNVAVTVLCSFYLRNTFYHLGLAFASVIAAWVQFFVLLFYTGNKEKRPVQYRLKRLLIEIIPFLIVILLVHSAIHSSEWWKTAGIFVHFSYILGCAFSAVIALFAFLYTRRHLSSRHIKFFWKIMRSKKEVS